MVMAEEKLGMLTRNDDLCSLRCTPKSILAGVSRLFLCYLALRVSWGEEA